MYVSNIIEKKNGWKDIHEILGKFGHETSDTLEHFRDLAVNPLNSISIFLFSGSVFVSNIMENGWTDFHEIFMICQERHT